MKAILVKDKEFRISIPAAEIQAAVRKVASAINRDYKGRNPLFVAVLNGSFMFAADLLRRISVPCEISFIKVSSYSGTSSTSTVQELIGLNQDIKGRHVIILEDIIDTGITLEMILEKLQKQGPEDIRIACFCHKPAAFQKSFTIDYLGMNIPNDFVIGYGLDYDGYGRNLADIYTIVKE
jgi:hypoxanthine phosphoribosyltransferase